MNIIYDRQYVVWFFEPFSVWFGMVFKLQCFNLRLYFITTPELTNLRLFYLPVNNNVPFTA